MEHNANHIIPSYCHLPVSCRSLVGMVPLGAVSHTFIYYFIYHMDERRFFITEVESLLASKSAKLLQGTQLTGAVKL